MTTDSEEPDFAALRAQRNARVRDRLRELGAPMPGFTSGGRRAGVAAAQQCADAIRAGAKEPSDG